jgi:hypothetical protein
MSLKRVGIPEWKAGGFVPTSPMADLSGCAGQRSYLSQIQLMKKLSYSLKPGPLLCALLLTGFNSSAQMPGMGAPAGMGTALAKLFGDVTAFTAKAEMQVLDSGQKEVMSAPMDFALLDGKIRFAMDVAQVKSSSMPPGAAEQVKALGMARIVSVIRPDKKLAYVIYPDMKSVLTVPTPKEEADAAAKPPKITKTPLGKETLDGHACTKNKVVISDDKGKSVEATTWNAADLKDFPIQIQTEEKANTSLIHFKQIEFNKPDAKQFDAPADYTVYNDQNDLMAAVMKKMQAATPQK